MTTSSPAETLQMGIQKHQSGAFEEARVLYGELLSVNPKHLDALRLMSMLASQQGNLHAALVFAEQAVNAAPNVAPLQMCLAQALGQLKRLSEALQCAQKATELEKRNSDAWLLLGDLQQQAGSPQNALKSYQRVEQLDKSIPELYNNRGNAYLALKDFTLAEKSYRQAIQRQPQYVTAFINLGKLFQETEQYEEAVEVLHHAYQLDSKAYHALILLGVCLRSLGRLDEAQAQYEKALALIPNDAAERPIALYNLGNVFSERKQLDAATQCYRKSLQLKPDKPEVLQNLANILMEQGDAEAAIEIFQRLSYLFPDEIAYRLNEAFALPTVYASHEALERWRQHYESSLDTLLASDLPLASPHFAERLTTTGFYLAYLGQDDFALQQKAGQIFRRLLGEPSTHYPGEAPFRKRSNGKRRIGFISANLANSHTIGKLMNGIIAHLNRDLFEVRIFSVGRLLAYEPNFLELPEDVHHVLNERNFEACRQALHDAELDILYFTDIGMDVVPHLLAHYRFAPIQCMTWGHPVTSGSPNIDIFFSSQWVEPENAQAHYGEKLIALENYPFYYKRPILQGDGLLVSRADLGLEAHEHLYSCVQSLFKLHPDTDRLFGEILRRDPDGILVLLSHPSDACNQAFLNRFARHYADVVDRVRFVQRLQRAEFLGLMAISDIVLDSIYFSGGNTSYEGFAVGAPIITLAAPYMKGRLTLGLAKMMGIEELIAHTEEDYIEKAVFYGTHPEERQALKDKILQQCPQLYERLEPVRELEAILMDQLDMI